MKFWDASAIVPLLVVEPQTRQLLSIVAKESAMLVWWGSEVEYNSALARRERDGALNARAMTLALRRLQQLADAWHEIDPSDAIRGSSDTISSCSPAACCRCTATGSGFPSRGASAKWLRSMTVLPMQHAGRDLQ